MNKRPDQSTRFKNTNLKSMVFSFKTILKCSKRIGTKTTQCKLQEIDIYTLSDDKNLLI